MLGLLVIPFVNVDQGNLEKKDEIDHNTVLLSNKGAYTYHVFMLGGGGSTKKKRNHRKFQTKQINSKRYKKSALPFMAKLLNDEEDIKRGVIKKIAL